MLTSRSVPQQTEQMFSPLAGQNLFTLRLLQIGQDNCYSWRQAVNDALSTIGVGPNLNYATTLLPSESIHLQDRVKVRGKAALPSRVRGTAEPLWDVTFRGF
jgi:hypothetical protein